MSSRLILLPGMDGTGSLFSDFISKLPQRLSAQVVAYPPDSPLGYSELQAWVANRLPEEPFILVAESFSGPIAIRIAAQSPPLLRGVALVCSFATTPVPRVLGSLLARLPLWRVPTALAAPFVLGRHSSPELRNLLSRAMETVTPETWRARWRAALTADATEQLRAVKVPLLYVRATADRLVGQSAWHLIKRTLYRARLAEIDGPHFLLQAKPVESAGELPRSPGSLGLGSEILARQ